MMEMFFCFVGWAKTGQGAGQGENWWRAGWQAVVGRGDAPGSDETDGLVTCLVRHGLKKRDTVVAWMVDGRGQGMECV